MWKEAPLSPKGQSTLPRVIRDQPGLAPGNALLAAVSKGHPVLSPRNISFNDLAGFFGDPPNRSASLEPIDRTAAVLAS